MTDRELLEAAAKAAAYVGQTRLWTPYHGAEPIECTAWNCGVNASFSHEGMTATVSAVWTNYRDFSGRADRVWFPAKRWETMPLKSGGPTTGQPERAASHPGPREGVDT